MVTPTKLYPLYCTLYLCTLTHRQLVTLSPAFVSDILQSALHWLQLIKCFSLTNQQTFIFKKSTNLYFKKINKPFPNSFFLLEVGRSYHSAQFWTHISLHVFCPFFLRSFRPWADIHPSSHFCIRLFLTLLVIFIFCVSHSNPQFTVVFSFNPTIIYQFIHYFALQCLPTLILLGTSAHRTFGLCMLFLSFQIWLVTI